MFHIIIRALTLVLSVKATAAILIFEGTVDLGGTTIAFIQNKSSSQHQFPFWGEGTIAFFYRFCVERYQEHNCVINTRGYTQVQGCT